MEVVEESNFSAIRNEGRGGAGLKSGRDILQPVIKKPFPTFTTNPTH